MSNNALVLLYRIYLDSKKKSEADGYDTVEKYAARTDQLWSIR